MLNDRKLMEECLVTPEVYMRKAARNSQPVWVSKSMADDIDAFAKHLEQDGHSPASILSWAKAFRQFLEALAESGITCFQDVTPEVYEGYIADKRRRKLRDATVETYAWAVKRFFAYQTTTCRILEDPTEGVVIYKHEATPVEALSLDEVQKLLEAPDTSSLIGLRDRAMIETLYATGMHKVEILSLAVSAVDPDRQTVRVSGDREQVLPLGKRASHYLSQYLTIARPRLLPAAAEDEPVDALWLSNFHGPLGSYGFEAVLRKHGGNASIAKPVSAPALRYTCAIHMLQNGTPPKDVAEIFGSRNVFALSQELRMPVDEIERMEAET